jgi:hypothetical protein
MNEIDNERPFDSRYYWLGNRHARVCKGYWVADLDYYWILINDPWPVDEGNIVWEVWDTLKHDYNVYVKP